MPIYARDPGDANRGGAPRQRAALTPGPRIDTYSARRQRTASSGGEIGPEDPIDGIKAKDWAAFVGRSPMYYLMQFFRMSDDEAEGHRLACRRSCLARPTCFYRKMWKAGPADSHCWSMVVLSVPSALSPIVATFNPHAASAACRLALGARGRRRHRARCGIWVVQG